MRNAGRLLALVDELLDLTALASGHLAVAAVPVTVRLPRISPGNGADLEADEREAGR